MATSLNNLLGGMYIGYTGSQGPIGYTGSAGSGSGAVYGVAASTATGGANLDFTADSVATDTVKFAQSKFATVTQTDVNTITVGTTYNISVGTTAPTSPQVGDLWVDTN